MWWLFQKVSTSATDLAWGGGKKKEKKTLKYCQILTSNQKEQSLISKNTATIHSIYPNKVVVVVLVFVLVFFFNPLFIADLISISLRFLPVCQQQSQHRHVAVTAEAMLDALSNGAAVNGVTGGRRATALMLAAAARSSGAPRCLQLLLDAQAEVDAKVGTRLS